MKPTASIPVFPILGFAAFGLFSFGVSCLILLGRPEGLAGDPMRGPVLALTHLVTLGWIGSLLFAAAYLVGPLLAEGPLWSRRLPGLHFVCHVSGLTLMIGGLAVLRYDVARTGAIVLFGGLVALVFNLVMTATKNSRWSPANVAFQSAMFWLAVTAALALFMLRGRLGGYSPVRPEVLVAWHAHFALFGFLAQALLGVSVRIVPELLGGNGQRRWFDGIAWCGWACLNGGLFLLIPATLVDVPGLLFAVGALVLLGVLGFAIHVAGSLWVFRRGLSWAAVTHVTGVLLLVALAASALWRLPGVASGAMAETRQWMRFYISLALLGPFSFAILGIGQRMIPRLVWRLRFAPWAGQAVVPEPGSLAHGAAGAPAYFSMLLAWTYLALGQWQANPQAIRLGALLMLVGFGWFVFCITPAIARLVLGVTPEDLKYAPAGPPDPASSQPLR